MYVKSNGLKGLGGDTGFDWGGLLKTAVTGYTQVQQAKAAKDIAVAQAKAQIAQPSILSYLNNPAYSGTYATGTGASASNIMPLLLLGGGALLIFMLLRK